MLYYCFKLNIAAKGPWPGHNAQGEALEQNETQTHQTFHHSVREALVLKYFDRLPPLMLEQGAMHC